MREERKKGEKEKKGWEYDEKMMKREDTIR